MDAKGNMSRREAVVWITVSTLFILGMFLFPKFRVFVSQVEQLLRAGKSAGTWILLGILAVLVVFSAVVSIVVAVLRGRLKEERIRRGSDRSSLEVPPDNNPQNR